MDAEPVLDAEADANAIDEAEAEEAPEGVAEGDEPVHPRRRRAGTRAGARGCHARRYLRRGRAASPRSTARSSRTAPTSTFPTDGATPLFVAAAAPASTSRPSCWTAAPIPTQEDERRQRAALGVLPRRLTSRPSS